MANRRKKRKSDQKNSDSSKKSESETRSEQSDHAADTSTEPNDVQAQLDATRARFAALPPLSRVMSVVMLILGILAVGALFYRVMAGFFVPLFLAVLLVVIFRPVHEWIFHRIGDKPRLAALSTTAIVLAVVLFPIILVISVATSQFTAMVSHVDFNDLTEAADRARQQIGISLEHEEKFRRLDHLADTFDQAETPEPEISNEIVLSNINETLSLLRYLQDQVDGPAAADLDAGRAEEKLLELARAIEEHTDSETDEIARIDAEEQFHRQSVGAAASIRTWMRTKLGGTFLSQVKLLANPSAEDVKKLLNIGREALQPRFVTMTSATGTFLAQLIIGLVVLVIAIYFFLVDGSAMIHTLMRLSPLDDTYEERLLLEFERTSRAVVLASVLSALVQGVLSAIAFYFLGFHSVILLFLLTSVMALVPFLGAASVWVPCTIYLAAVDQRWTAAIFLAIYGATVVSSIDNVIKMYVLHGRSTLHPLFALLSVLGGVKVFGPIGILVGPMVVVFLQTLLEILNHELEERAAHKIES